MTTEEVFLFQEHQSGLFNRITLETNSDERDSSIKIEKAKDKLKGKLGSEIEINFNWDNDVVGRNNRRELRRFAIALFEATKEVDMRITLTDVMSKVKVKTISYKYLRDFLSIIELCYVTFSDDTCAIIGDYVKLLTGGDDCVFIDTLLEEEIDFGYDVHGLSLEKAITSYFKSVEGKEVKTITIAASPVLVKFLKDNYLPSK